MSVEHNKSVNGNRGIWIKLTGISLLALILTTCIDPFSPRTENFESLLVVDALITNEYETYYCTLSRSIQNIHDTPVNVRGATVTVKDDLGAVFTFKETSPGKYKSDSLSFRAEAGRTYILHIVTKEGETYESDHVTMPEVPAIDSLYYGKDKKTDDEGVLHDGVQIYIDSKKPQSGTYLRWTYEEWWKTHVPYQPLFKFLDENNIVPVLEPDNVICWRNNKSSEIIAGSPDGDPGSEFRKRPLFFIASDHADRLMVQYYIKIRQYSITKNEYEFWDQMQQIRDVGGDIFDRQPFQVISNIHNIDSPNDRLLGYFQVSSVSDASMYITRREVDSLNLQQFDYGCEILYASPDTDFPGKPAKQVSFTQMYNIIVKEGYVFIDYVSFESGLVYLVFVRDYCADCTVTGNPDKPDFWVDIN
jgi:hypothetical protein